MNERAPSLPMFGGLHLTFDDGPDPTWTPRCLEVLAQAQAKATFFVIGMQARKHPALVRRVAREGHTLGNHTLTHAHPWTIGTRRAIGEVRAGAAAIADIVGERPTLFRPPHGAHRRCMLAEANAQGEAIVMWNVSAIDWGWLGTSQRIAKRLERAKDGDIVLMHDGTNQYNRPDELFAVLPLFLEGLSRKKAQRLRIGGRGD